MNELELELKRRIKRVEAPRGLLPEVMARVRYDERKKPTGMGWWWSVFAVAMLLIAIGLGGVMRHEQERRQAAAEQERFALAMRITARTLAHVDVQVSRAGVKYPR